MAEKHKEAFAQAILSCQKAIKAEGSSKEASYYEEAISLLAAIIPNLPEEIQQQVTEKVWRKYPFFTLR